MSGYNGWPNRATWNVSLWLSNEEGLYNDVNVLERRYVRDPEPDEESDVEDFAKALKAYCEELWSDGLTPDGDALAEADFEEIARSWVAG